MQKRLIGLLLLGLVSLLPWVAFAQAISGDLVGIVKDTSGALVADAPVEASNLATGQQAFTRATSAGTYHFVNLPVGHYKVQATSGGLQGGYSDIEVKLNETATANITASVAGSSTTIEVTGQVTLIDTTTPQIENAFESAQIASSPVTSTGSGVVNLSLLNAGVASSGGVGVGSGPSVSGQRPRNNNFTVEGVDNNSKSTTGPLLQVPNDAVDEFTVLQNQFSPEYGHSSGGQFNQTIKAGTNSFHGRLYEYFQNQDLNAQDSLTALSQRSLGLVPSNVRYDNNRFGGQVGGPILHDKLFFFTNWEYNPIGQVASSSACAPTAAGYTALASLIPAGVSSTNLSQFQKYAGAALAQAGPNDPNCFPTTSVLGTDIPIGPVGYLGNNYNNTLTGVQSADWNISGKDQLRLRYGYSKNNQVDYIGQIPSFWTINPNRYHLFTLGEYHIFNPNLSNEFRFGFNRVSSDYPAGSFTFPGLGTFPTLYVGFAEGSGVQLGPDPDAPQFGVQNTYQFVDNVSWVKGRHNFKFGAEYREYIAPQSFTQRVRGEYDYGSFEGYFTDQVPDYLAERSIGNTTYYGNQNAFYAYANDEWRITRSFTLNAGLRYEYTQVPLSERKFQPLNSISNVPGLITFGAPTAQTSNFLPRVGFAWSPGGSGTTVVRGGFGMALDVLYDNLGVSSLPPQLQQTCDATPGDQSGATATCYWSDPSLGQQGFLQGGGLPFTQNIPPITDAATARQLTSAYIPNQKLPYSENWSIGISHVFADHYTLEVRYVGTRGIHLPLQTRLNRQAKTTATEYLPTFFSAPSQSVIDALPYNLAQIRSNSSYVPVYGTAGFDSASIVSWQPWGASRYNGLQVQFNRSFTNGLQFQAAYTWSHTIDNSTADVASTVLTPRRPQDFQCVACDYSDSALDRRQRFTLAATYDLPFFKNGNWYMQNLVGNWQFTSEYTFQSPEYATVQSGIDTNLNGDSAADRVVSNPNGIARTGSDVSPLCTSSLPSKIACGSSKSYPYLVGYVAENPMAQFVVAGSGARADIGRNTLSTPHINNFNMAVTKRFNVTERQSFEFQAQALNVFNHPQFVPGYLSDVGPLGTGGNVLGMLLPSSQTFNNPASVFSNHPRELILVLKYNF